MDVMLDLYDLDLYGFTHDLGIWFSMSGFEVTISEMSCLIGMEWEGF